MKKEERNKLVDQLIDKVLRVELDYSEDEYENQSSTCPMCGICEEGFYHSIGHIPHMDSCAHTIAKELKESR